MSKCKNCPVACDKPCVAELFGQTSLCDKVNPDHPFYKEAYTVIIADKSCGTNNYKPTGKKKHKEPTEKVAATIKAPGFLEKAVNFTGAAVKHLKGGMKNVSAETQLKRISICEGCEFFDSDPAKRNCLKCGCKMDVKSKWASSRCPLDEPKWIEATPDEIETPNQTKSCCGG
jgi:hypothetical protein